MHHGRPDWAEAAGIGC